MHSSVLAAMFVVFLAVGDGSSSQFRSMQQPAPIATFPATPSPDACMVEPRDAESLLALLGPPEPGGFPTTVSEAGGAELIEVPVGRPATTEIKEGIVATVHEFYACSNSGDMRSAFALGTDRYLQDYDDLGTLTNEDIAFLTGDPVSVPVEFHTAVIAVSNVTVLGDGRAAAFVTTETPFEDPATEIMIFVQQDGRWLLDEVIELALQ